MVLAYSPENFGRLMRTGESATGNELDLMAQIAVSRFSSFSDEEVANLHAYLKELGPGVEEPETKGD